MSAIDIVTLEILFKRIMGQLRSHGIDRVEFSSDLYKLIPTDKWGITVPDEIVIGSLDDDIEEITKIAKDPDRICTYVDFDRVASILRAISETINPVGE